MTLDQIRAERQKDLTEHKYEMRWWQGFNYPMLKAICSERRRSYKDTKSYSDAIIMGDTETSKLQVNTKDQDGKYIPVTNIVVAWTISIRVYGQNIVTLYGKKPSDMIYCIKLIRQNIKADNMFIYYHNLSYDWIFLRKFLIKEFGEPVKALNVKSHYPISIEFENGIILKDSLILAQKKLEKWAEDLDVEHKKAVGSWDYDKLRHQNGRHFTDEELHYIENDTLAGVECIDKTMQILGKSLITLPMTATGIPREQIRKRGVPFKAHNNFKKMDSGVQIQLIFEKLFHGGFVHANRHFVDYTVTKDLFGHLVKCFDFASSYPFCMLAFKFPTSKFFKLNNCSIKDIMEKSEQFCFIFKLIMIRPRLKDYDFPMPALQYSKCEKIINPILDNGRVLGCDYCEIYLNEIDVQVILNQYTFDKHLCVDVHYANKGYLPKYFRDYIFELFEKKTRLKGEDPILYNLAKATLNSCYGMCVQKPIKADIAEDYETGQYIIPDLTAEEFTEKYDAYINKRTSVLPFSWGVYVTSYAYRNLFELGKCVRSDGQWLYSDTDSCYAAGWAEEKINAYNENCKKLITESGYGPVIHKGREYWLGVAEHDGDKDTYTEFRFQGAKRYAGRCLKDGELHITVAGVPKKTGAIELKNDLSNFTPGFIFKGENTGKKTHTYIYRDKIDFIEGDEVGDSIDLTPCDYKLDGIVSIEHWEDLIHEDIDLPTFGQEDLYD